jgi:hypothetical protein
MKDNLALDFVRNTPMNNTLVNIDNEFLMQQQMSCLLEPQQNLEDVVSIVLFILNNNTHQPVYIYLKLFFWTNIGSQYVHSLYKVQSAYRGLGRW